MYLCETLIFPRIGRLHVSACSHNQNPQGPCVKNKLNKKKGQWQRELLQAVRNHDDFSRSNQQQLDLEHGVDILVQVACTAHSNFRGFLA